MPTIADIKKQYPDFGELDDDQVVDAVHQSFYRDLSRDEIASALGVKQAAAPTQKTGMLRTMGDQALALGQGAVGGVKMLSDLAGPDNAVSQALGGANTTMQGMYSPARAEEMRNRQALIQAADDGASTMGQITTRLGGIAEAPMQTLLQAGASMAPNIAAALATGGVSAGPGLVAFAARFGIPAALGVGMGVGSVKGQNYEAVFNKAKQGGATDEAAIDLAIKASEYSAQNAPQQALGGALGALDSMTGAERIIGSMTRKAGTEAAPKVAQGLLKRTALGGLEEAPAEGAQGAQGQYAQNEAMNNSGFKTDPWAGVAGAGINDAVVGAMVGGPMGAMHNPAVAPNVAMPQQAAADQIRATELVPESGAMTRAANAGTEAKARAVELMPSNFSATPAATSMEGPGYAGTQSNGTGFSLDSLPSGMGAPAEIVDQAELDSLVETERRDQQVMLAQMDQERQKQAEIDASFAAKPELDATTEAVNQASTVDAPNAMQAAFNKLNEQSAPQEQVAPAAPAKEPRIVVRTPGMNPMPLELAELQVSMAGGEVARVQNANGKFGYVVAPKAPTKVTASNVKTAPGTQAGDVLNKQGNPFTNLFSAKTEASKQGPGFEPVKLREGAFVVRQVAQSGNSSSQDQIAVTPTPVTQTAQPVMGEGAGGSQPTQVAPPIKSTQGNTNVTQADQAVQGQAKQQAPERAPEQQVSDHIGQGNKPLTEGGKPFKTKLAATLARKQQPMLRVVKSGKGFALAIKTEKQIAAQEAAARRLSIARTGTAGVPTSAHEFIAGEGGMDASTKNEFGFGNNPRVGNRTLFAGARGGMSLDAATEKLIEAGYLPQGATHSDTVALVNRSFTVPQHTADGTEVLAEAAMNQHFDDYLTAQEEAAQDDAFDPFDSVSDMGFTLDDAEWAGYDALEDPIKLEVDALLAQADALGIDTDTIKEGAHENTRNGSEQDYYDATRDALTSAIEASNRSSSQNAGTPGNAGGEEGVAKPLYASRAVTNAADIIAWAQSQGFKTTLPANDMHVTVAYSSEPVDGAKAGKTSPTVSIEGGSRTVEPLGDGGAVVLKFASGELQSRWKQYRDVGASWDYEGYTPHVTLTYDASGVDLSKVTPYTGPINLGEETQEPLNEDKADEYVEAPTLTTPTRAEVLAQQERADSATRAETAQRKAQNLADKQARERKDIAKASEAAADTFVLGGDAEQNLSGQGSIFDEPVKPEEKTEAQPPIKFDYATDFSIRPVEIIENLMDSGVIKALYKAAGVKTANAFDGLPMESQSNAYAKFVKDGGTPAPAATESYNDKVTRMEREIVVRRLKSDQNVNQANGKPFKTEASAKQFSAEFDLDDTHKVAPSGAGYTLQRLGEGQRPSVLKAIAERQANDPEEIRQNAAWAKAEAIGTAADAAVLAYGNGDTSIEEFERALDAAPVSKTEATAKPADQATAILDAANVTGKERIDALKDIKKGDITPDELKAAYPANESGDKAAESKPAKIEDSGQVLEGARKLYAKNYAAKLDEGAGMDTATVPLSKSWPEPDYQRLIDEGADPWAVAMTRAMRDEVPTKPSSWKLKGWVQKVEALRDMAAKVMSGEMTQEKFKTTGGQFNLADWFNKIDLYEAVGHAKSLKTLKFSMGEYGMYGGQTFKPAKKLWTVNMPGTTSTSTWSRGNWGNDLVVADTKAEAIEKFKAWSEAQGEKAPTEAKATSFDIYSYRSKPGITIVGKRINSTKSIDLKEFTTVKEAREYKEANQSELESLLAKAKFEPSERGESNSPRVGADHRSGADVTSEQFRETFGFRGEQFGASMPQNERQANMNQAYDALMDLAGVVGIPPKALSLNGELGLAFGARGTGGKNPAAAHYERDTTGAVTPNRVVINLTRKNGAGSLGHEWFHAVDNYFARMRGEKAGMLTDSYASRGEGVRPEMVAAFKQLMATIQTSGIKERSKQLDKKRVKDYWSTGLEMAARSFESYVIAKLQDNNGSNDYLANIVPESLYSMQSSYPYPIMGEMPAIRAAFDNFFNTVQTKETDQGVAMFSRNEDSTGLPSSQVTSIVKAIKSKWSNSPEIIIASNMSDPLIPQSVRDFDQKQKSLGAQGEPEGFVHGGKVYLLTEQLPTQEDVVRVLFHESLGHMGLRGVFGDSLKPILKQIAAMRRGDVAAKAEQYGLDMSKEADRLTAAEEVLAEMAEKNPTLGFVKRAIAAIRNWLRANVPGFSNMKLTDEDIIQQFILPARAFVEKGAPKAGKSNAMLESIAKRESNLLDLLACLA